MIMMMVWPLWGVSGATNYRKARIVTGSTMPEPVEEAAVPVPQELLRRLPLAPPSGPAMLLVFGDRCLRTQQESSEQYELCLFENATQTDTNGNKHVLGLWGRWIDKRSMRFTNGDRCPNAAPRNLTVHIACGSTTMGIASPFEPSMCNYEMVLRVPVSCDVFDFAIDDYLRRDAPALTQAQLFDQELDQLRSHAAALEDENSRLRQTLKDLQTAAFDDDLHQRLPPSCQASPPQEVTLL